MDSSTAPIQQDAPFRYADLPAELRERILKLLLHYHVSIRPSEPEHNPAGLRESVSVLSTNRQVYQEAAHVLYHTNLFSFPIIADIEAWLNQRLTITNIDHALIHLDISSLGNNDTMQASEWYRFLTLLHQAGPKLKSLLLTIRSTTINMFGRSMLVRIANQMLEAGIRNLEFLAYTGPPAFDDDDFRERLNVMLTDPQRKPVHYLP